jgi:hypothetical protein
LIGRQRPGRTIIVMHIINNTVIRVQQSESFATVGKTVFGGGEIAIGITDSIAVGNSSRIGTYNQILIRI